MDIFIEILLQIHYASVIFLMLTMMCQTLSLKTGAGKDRSAILAFSMIYFVFYWLLCSLVNLGNYSFPIYLATIVLTAWLYALRLSGCLQLKILLILFYLNMIVASTVFTSQILYGIIHIADENYARVISSVFCFLLLLGINQGLKSYTLPPNIGISNLLWGIWLFAMAAVFISLLLWKPVAGPNEFYYAQLLQSTITIILAFIMYLLFVRVISEYTEKMQNEFIRQKLELQLREIELLNSKELSFRKERHEWKNKLFYMKMLLEEKNFSELYRLISSIQSRLENTERICCCGNETIDRIINTKAAEATEKNIPVLVNAKAPPHLSLSDEELCSLMMNLLDNAIEASQNEKKPEIQVKIYIVKKYLILEVKNKVSTDILAENAELKTTKKAAEYHGMGVKIMKEITEKYDGSLTTRMEGGYFVVAAVIKI